MVSRHPTKKNWRYRLSHVQIAIRWWRWDHMWHKKISRWSKSEAGFTCTASSSSPEGKYTKTENTNLRIASEMLFVAAGRYRHSYVCEHTFPFRHSEHYAHLRIIYLHGKTTRMTKVCQLSLVSFLYQPWGENFPVKFFIRSWNVDSQKCNSFVWPAKIMVKSGNQIREPVLSCW